MHNFEKSNENISVCASLTQSTIYFSTGSGQEDIFEICMIAYEFTDSGEFEKYNRKWLNWRPIF